jgi:HD superfamily phosphodiesterase
MSSDIVKIADFVRDYLLRTGSKDVEDAWGPNYRWEHTQRVACWALRLANEERADAEECVVAALFHDVSHFTCGDYRRHGTASAEIARDYLQKNGYDKDFVENVAYAVEAHVAEPNPKTLEAKILQDADTLDRFGCFRMLLFGKKADTSKLEDLRKEVNSSKAYLDKLEKGEFGPMWTNTGKTKLKELTDLNRSFLKGIVEELENTRTPATF